MSSSPSGCRQLRLTIRSPAASRCAAARFSACRPEMDLRSTRGPSTLPPNRLRGGFGGRIGGGGRALRLVGLFAALLALDAGGLALELAQIVEPRAPDFAARHDLDPLDARRVQREDALDADAVRDLPDREGGARTAAVLADHDALEDLDALLVAFLDQRVNANAVAGAKIGQIGAPIAALDLLQQRMQAHGKPVYLDGRRARVKCGAAFSLPRADGAGRQARHDPAGSSSESSSSRSSFSSSSVSGWAAIRSGRRARVSRTDARRRQRAMAAWSP